MVNPHIIGVVGTAKNTGKTTTLSSLMQQARHRGLRLGVTGIGYDGEELDNITFLPKPRLHVSSNTIVTTSELCLAISTAKYEVLERTGIVTSLGEVLILRITQPGLVVVAGPNRKSTLARVVGKMKNVGVDILLIDGSLNRLAPLAIAEKIIFTTGAARDINISVLAEEMRTIERAFSFQTTARELPSSRSIALLEKSNTSNLPLYSLLDTDDASTVLENLTDKTEYVYIPGLISASAMQSLIERLPKNHPEIILSDPFTLLLASEPLVVSSLIELIEKNKVRISFASKLQLTAITINPFYPKLTGTAFAAAFVDKNEMMSHMHSAIHTPVFNVKEEESEILFSLCVGKPSEGFPLI
jgi:hypothetical protein